MALAEHDGERVARFVNGEIDHVNGAEGKGSGVRLEMFAKRGEMVFFHLMAKHFISPSHQKN